MLREHEVVNVALLVAPTPTVDCADLVLHGWLEESFRVLVPCTVGCAITNHGFFHMTRT